MLRTEKLMRISQMADKGGFLLFKISRETKFDGCTLKIPL